MPSFCHVSTYFTPRLSGDSSGSTNCPGQKQCFKEERNGLFSAHLVNGTKGIKAEVQIRHERKLSSGVSGVTAFRCSMEEVFKNRTDRCLPKGM